jgi:nickel-dependent lactate racemase
VAGIRCIADGEKGISDAALRRLIRQLLEEIKRPLKKVLIIPPDLTRMHSGAGRITEIYWELLKDTCTVDVMPALGTHEPMTKDECREFFGSVPYSSILTHNWREDVVKIGQVPGAYIHEISEGLISEPVDVEVNRRIVDPAYDLILSVGQVVPHEVVGMANYSKNIFVGCGGSNMISRTHFLGALYGMERLMGRDFSPVRKVFDYAEERFLQGVPLVYVLTVTTQAGDKAVLHGIFIGRERALFEEAVKLSREKNMTFVDKPLKKVVVYLNEREFKSTWLGNKAIYRTRMAIADGGELIVLAPGVRKFGEDPLNDELIRKYGYCGRDKVLSYAGKNQDLKENLSVAAHLIHGSSDGRFSVTYAAGALTREEVEGVYFRYMPYGEAVKKYDPDTLEEGVNILDDGEEIFYIGNPALGLWATKNRRE